MRPILIALAALVAIAANLALWAVPNRPVQLAPLPGGRIDSVSFAPFRDGQSPLTHVYPTAAEIDQDLKVLSGQVKGVRTYTSREGLEVVPALARKYGMTVTAGAWLSSKLVQNEAEIQALIDEANRYPDVIKRVIVGNEVLLRGDLTPEQLMGYLKRVRAAVKQPVSYADVWEWWLKYPEVAQDVDYVTIHMLPYWEDVPTGVDDIAAHIDWVYRQIHNRFPTKPILIGEAGWPTLGRSRGPAVPGVVNEAKFVDSFVRLAHRRGFDYNIVEAFDQPWKSALEGTVGAHWGLYTVGRHAKFPVAGPVVEDPQWPLHAALSIGIGLALFAWLLATARGLAPGRAAIAAVLTQGGASALVGAGLVALGSNFTSVDQAEASLQMLLQAALLVAVPAAAAGLSRPRLVAFANFALRLLSLIALVASVLLIANGRYRDFPVPAFVIPALGGLALAALGHGGSIPGTMPRWQALAFAVLLPLGGIGVAVNEGFAMTGGHYLWLGLDNHEALFWAAELVALAVPYALALRHHRHPARPEPGYPQG